MKRKGNLYKDTYDIRNLVSVFNEICRNTRNKNKVMKFQAYKTINIYRIYETLKNREYVPTKPHEFVIYEPKKRIIESQTMEDKMVNHLVSRYILYPAILEETFILTLFPKIQ